MSQASQSSKSPVASGHRWKLVLGLGCVALLSVGLALGNDGTPSTDQAEAPQRSPGTIARFGVVAAGSSGRLCSFEPGVRMAYEVRSQTDVEIDMSRLSSGVDAQASGVEVAATPPQHHVVDRSWHLELAALARNDDGSSVLAARIEDRGTQVEGEGIVAPNNAHLSDTFLIRVDADCSLREFGWRSEGDLEAAYEQQVMAAGLGFSGPAKTNEASTYGAVNFDATGRYRANYRYESNRIEGEATSYVLGREAQRGAAIEVAILASNIEVELGAGAWFQTLTNQRDLEFRLDGREFGTHFRATTATRVEPGTFKPEIDLGDGGWSWGLVPSPRHDPSSEFQAALRDKPLDDVLVGYRELIAAGDFSKTRQLLRDWLRANPEQTGGLIDLLEAGEFDGNDSERAILFAALGEANTDQAKGALTDILGDWPRLEEQIWAAHAVSAVAEPSAEMIELIASSALLESRHPMERSTMALALGTVAGGDSEGAALARSQIQAWLETPADDAQLELGLAAAGNAGSDQLVESVAAWLEHETPELRKKATKALRQMSPEQVAPHLELALADEDTSVRTTALETAVSVARKHNRAPSESVVGHAAASLVEAGDHERQAALALLGEASRRGDPRADQALRTHLSEQLASGDASARELAAIGRNTPSHWKLNN